MILCIVIIAFLVLIGINVVYEIRRAKRIKTKVDPEVYRKSDTHG